MSDFAPALVKTLIHEGGFVDNPNDHGGRTNKGITQRVYDICRARKTLPPQDVLHISDSEVSDIYHEFYWKPCHAQEIIAQPVGEKLFDLYVNCRPTAAIKILQQACMDSGHPIMADGVMGPVTIAAANACNPHDLLDAMRHRAQNHYLAIVQHDPTQSVFLKGWLARAMS